MSARGGWRIALVSAWVLSLAACATAGRDAGTSPRRPLTGQALAADGALECPPTIADSRGLTVPKLPEGRYANDRLFPPDDPASLAVCRYPVLDITSATPVTAPYAVERRTVPDAAVRARIVETLTWAPRGTTEGKVCTEMGGNETVYLVGATYHDAVVWVAAKADPNSCSGATNGDFTSRAAVGVVVEAVLGGGEPLPQATGGCDTRTMGRLGDEVTLAPEGDPLVTVCRTTKAGAQQATRLTAGQSHEVVTALRGLVTRPTTGTCEGGEAEPGRAFRLVLAYAAGPDSTVNVVPGCEPPVLGDGVEADDPEDVVPIVEQWSKPIPGPDPDAPVSTPLSPAPDAGP